VFKKTSAVINLALDYKMAWTKDRGFVLNPKCVVISGGAVACYYLLPQQNIWVAWTIGIGTYIGIAYYDHFFECSDRLSIDNPISILVPGVRALKPEINWETRTYG
jgi:hypothetical protein